MMRLSRGNPKEVAMITRFDRRFAVAAASIAVLFFGIAFDGRSALAEGEQDCEPVVSATIDGGATISGVPEGERLWDQTADCSILGTSSQDFSDLGIVTECADDFVVPVDQKWDLRYVLVDGAYLIFDKGPADAVNLVFYADAAGLPGAAIHTFNGLTPVAGLDSGDFVLQITSPVVLAPGRYWVSVQADMPFFHKGQWFWQVRHQSTELERVFRNPDDFFHTGCTDFDQASDCGFLVGLGKPDHCFAVIGELVEECADLTIEKTASSDRVAVGGRLTYFLEVTNLGPADAVDVEVFDAFPDQLSVEGVIRPAGWSSSLLSDVLRASTPLLAAGETVTFEIETLALSARHAVVNTASVSSATEDCDPENNEDDVTVRTLEPSDPSVPTFSEIGLALFVLLMGMTLFFVARRA
jgi:uncharacterized repeat protein (TIGR01451 family)